MNIFEHKLDVALNLLIEGQYKLPIVLGGNRYNAIIEVNPLGNKCWAIARTKGGARGFTDEKGNVYLWPYDQGVHDLIADTINDELEATGGRPIQIAVPFYVDVRKKKGEEVLHVHFSGFTDGTVSSHRYADELRASKPFNKMIARLGYDPIADESPALTFGIKNPFGEVWEDDDDY